VHDMTMSEVLKDPLIRQMLRADKISLGVFAELLQAAANERARVFAGPGRDEFPASAYIATSSDQAHSRRNASN
jgi:hypothetical protein